MPRQTPWIAVEQTCAQFAKVSLANFLTAQGTLWFYTRPAIVDENEPETGLCRAAEYVDNAHVTLLRISMPTDGAAR
jgi:hypothetical protein